MTRLVATILAVVLAAFAVANVASAQPMPEFRMGFKTLADQVPTIVGQPRENEHYGPTGDSLQMTSAGLMAWRKADNWTAFTNGSRTWINGPGGVQERANDERFDWEGAREQVVEAPSSNAPQSPAISQLIWEPGPYAHLDSAVTGAIDSPKDGEVVTGVLAIVGWASGQKAPMEKFDVYLDAPESGGGRRLPVTVERPLRTDLEAAGMSQYLGFRLLLDLGQVGPGVHSLYINASNPAVGWWMKRIQVTLGPLSAGAKATATSMPAPPTRIPVATPPPVAPARALPPDSALVGTFRGQATDQWSWSFDGTLRNTDSFWVAVDVEVYVVWDELPWVSQPIVRRLYIEQRPIRPGEGWSWRSITSPFYLNAPDQALNKFVLPNKYFIKPYWQDPSKTAP